MAIRSHVADASRWSRDEPVHPSWIVGAALGMAVPMAVGAATGQVPLGMLASLGGLALSGVAAQGTLRRQSIQSGYALVAGAAAILVGSAIGGQAWITGVAIVVTTILAALMGGVSRTAARYSSMFIIFVIIGSIFGGPGAASPLGVTFIFLLGAIWTISVTLAASYLFRAAGWERIPSPGTIADRQLAPPSILRLLRHWLASLHHLAGWQYTLRIGLCMTACETIAVLWGQAQSYWIAIVVAIVVHRRFGDTISRVSKRAIGTFAGVIAGSLLLLWSPPAGLLVLVVAVLAALRPLLKVRNYALYSAVMTPLVFILLEFGNPVSPAIIAFRLIDTAIGLFIAIVLGYLIWPSRHSKISLSVGVHRPPSS